MPWTADDAPKHTKKANTSAKKKKWAKVANAALKSCQAKGDKDCEGYAIRVANAAMSLEEEFVMTKKTEKVPQGALCLVDKGHEAVVEFEKKDGEEKKPRLSMLLYSGKIISDHWWWGDLAIDVSGIKMSKRKIPILESHDTSRKVGFSNKVKFDDNEVRVGPEGVTFVDTEASKEFIDLSAQGFPFEASLRGNPTRIQRLAEKETAEVNGFTMSGPGTIWRQTELEEASVCVFGYDRRTSASAFAKQEVELEFEELSRQKGAEDEDREDSKNRKEVKGMDKETLKKEHPDTYQAIFDEGKEAGKSGAVEAFSQEKEGLGKEITALKEDNAEKATKILNLEKSETIRTEKERKSLAKEIWDGMLSDSQIPEHLYAKVREHVSYSQFMDDKGNLKETEFKAAITEEIKSWEDSGVKSSVIGSSFGKKELGSTSEEEEANQLDQETTDQAKVMLKIVGQNVEESS